MYFDPYKYPKENIEGLTDSLATKMQKGVDYVTAGQMSGTTLGRRATAEGSLTTASGEGSHAEGSTTIASGQYSHAEGFLTEANHARSHAEGYVTQTGNNNQNVQGKYNVGKSTTAFEIGNGTGSSARSNAFEVDWDGNVVASGDITDGDGNVLAEKVDYADISSEKTVTGNPITLTDALPVPVKSLVAKVEAIQDLHGYSGAWFGGARKNKLNIPSWVVTTEDHGVTFTIKRNEGGAVTEIDVDGTADGEASVSFNTSLPLASVTMTGAPSDGGGNYVIYRWDTDFHNAMVDRGSGVTFTNGTVNNRFKIIVVSGTVANHVKFYPMVRLSTVSDATFEPYSNICPITGIDEVVTEVDGKNICSQSSVNNTVLAKVKRGITYTFSCKVASGITVGANWYKYYGEGIPKVQIGTGIPFTFTADEDFDLYINGYVSSGSSTFANAVSNFQLEVGSSATTYEPYNGSTYTKSLGDTYYGFNIDLISGVMTVTDVLRTYTGAEGENWTKSAVTECDIYMLWDTTMDASKAFKINEFTRAGSAVNSIGYAWRGSQNAQIRFGFAEYNTTDLDSFKTWLASNPLKVCVALANPTTVQLTAELIELLRGYNYISSSALELIITYLANRCYESESKVEQSEVATVENGDKASRAYAVNEFMMWKGGLYKVTQAIASGATITSGTNVTKTTIGAVLTALLNG